MQTSKLSQIATKRLARRQSEPEQAPVVVLIEAVDGRPGRRVAELHRNPTTGAWARRELAAAEVDHAE